MNNRDDDPPSFNTGTLPQTGSNPSVQPDSESSIESLADTEKVSHNQSSGTGTLPQTGTPSVAESVAFVDSPTPNTHNDSRNDTDSVAYGPPSIAALQPSSGTVIAGRNYDPEAVSKSGQSAANPFAPISNTSGAAGGPSIGKRDATVIPSEQRFTVLRPLAKGGMGQVAVARDEELSRDVALKDIQARYARDRAVRTRFLREATITGRLEHPGIVPVYSLNYYPDGRPYYAMRFITGESLQDAIYRYHKSDPETTDNDTRSLMLRQLLQRFIDVCNTIAYAHNRHILHRDLKPANVMLGPYGETLVVDWGLAKDLSEQEVEAEPGNSTLIIPSLAYERPVEPTPNASGPSEDDGETKTRVQQDRPAMSLAGPAAPDDGELTEIGKAMGTPAFMAPEQADGRWDDVREAADIYSLGATLYAILGGHAPYRGTVDDILDKVKVGAFIPLKIAKPDVPEALIAIVEKAMATKPIDRYPTALDLAVDVERWLADEPVSVYREPWSVRATRWARRHRTAVLGGLATLLTAFTLTIGGLYFVTQEQKRTAAAKDETDKANTALAKTNVDLRVANDLANTNRLKAEKNREEARQALFSLVDDAIGDILTSQHAATGQQKIFLENVIDRYRSFMSEAPDTADAKLFIAGASSRVGRLLVKLGNQDAATKAYQEVFRLAEGQQGDAWTELLGETHLYYGIQCIGRSEFDRAVDELMLARQLFFDLIGQATKAGTEGQPLHWHRLGQAEDRLGLAYYNQSHYPVAEEWFRTSLTNRRQLLTLRPNVPEYEYRVAQSLRQIAMVCFASGAERRAEGVAAALEARAIQQRLLSKDPTSSTNLALLAEIDVLLSLNNVSLKPSAARPFRTAAKVIRAKLPKVASRQTPTTSPATESGEEAVRTWSRLVDLYPADVGYRQQLVGAYLALIRARQLDEVRRGTLETIANGLAVVDELERRVGADASTSTLRGRLLHARAIEYRERDELPQAETAAREAIVVAEKLLQQQNGDPSVRNDVALYQLELAHILHLQGQLEACERMLGQAWANTATAARQKFAERGATTDRETWANVELYRRNYADLLADLGRGRYDQFTTVAKDIRSLGVDRDEERFQIAALYGRGVILATRTNRADVIDELVGHCWDALQAIEDPTRYWDRLRSEPDFEAIRNHREFAEATQAFRELAPAPRASGS